MFASFSNFKRFFLRNAKYRVSKPWLATANHSNVYFREFKNRTGNELVANKRENWNFLRYASFMNDFTFIGHSLGEKGVLKFAGFQSKIVRKDMGSIVSYVLYKNITLKSCSITNP